MVIPVLAQLKGLGVPPPVGQGGPGTATASPMGSPAVTGSPSLRVTGRRAHSAPQPSFVRQARKGTRHHEEPLDGEEAAPKKNSRMFTAMRMESEESGQPEKKQARVPLSWHW